MSYTCFRELVEVKLHEQRFKCLIAQIVFKLTTNTTKTKPAAK